MTFTCYTSYYLFLNQSMCLVYECKTNGNSALLSYN